MSENLPTVLTDDIKNKIADLVAGGLDPEKDKEKIALEIGIPVEHLKSLFLKERQELLLRKAELTSKELLEIDLDQPNLEAKFGPRKLALLKLKQTQAQFILESLGKDIGYSKRTEVTGAGGEAISIREVIFNAPMMPVKNNEKD